jgi:DNA-binding CsgD family transcriptional regulator
MAWQHIVCALDINRVRTMDLHSSPNEQRALALVTRSGLFEIVDRNFMRILRTEWPDQPDTRLPQPVMHEIQNDKSYLGKHLEIVFSPRGDYLLCEARCLGPGARLSSRESQVAYYFSIGHSYKEVARILDISPNTVRVQLARVYEKLEINDKAMLGSALQAGGN